MSTLSRIVLSRLRMPLIRPYRLSYRTFEEFEPFLVEVVDSAGRKGFADAHISPGSSSETREGGWAFSIARIKEMLGRDPEDAKAVVLDRFEESKAAVTALATAIEVMQRAPVLDVPADTRLPLLTPVNALERATIPVEIEKWLEEGFQTFKVKVGKDVAGDLERLAVIKESLGDRGTIRLDANRAFSRDQALDFVRGLDPSGIDLFEQPCDSDDWDANAAVACASPVPLMLDEPICTLEDIDRAADLEGVGFCKLKLKRFGSLARLEEGLRRVSANGMEPVLGDGLGSEIQSWLEACVARTTIDNAGEFNGFLKPRDRLFADPLRFTNGAVELPAGYWPTLDRAAVERFTVERLEF